MDNLELDGESMVTFSLESIYSYLVFSLFVDEINWRRVPYAVDSTAVCAEHPHQLIVKQRCNTILIEGLYC